ncbi:ankyrin repeat domain-containing protein [Roseivirga sp. E12]|uniref:ankyrin repeat domain-containing protein n=1 Tax=Roseivirga sp. E12 TaxID=2819237 RepID=UPI001ABBFC58|nr:ankyrin repeat domain-containing protein [Roseivirga sp. E12]MBO3699894.1 ankyrin repeat domain-containing protein [Roseivirga sp. E12]
MKYKKTNFLKVGVAILLLTIGFSLQSCNAEKKENSEDKSAKAPTQTLFESAFLGKTDLVKQHIAAGTELNQKDDFGSTALTIAITFDKTEAAKALIEGGADIEATSADGSTALHSAAFFGRTEIVKALLAKGANTNARNSFGSTALESVQAPFKDVKAIYDQIKRDLAPLGLKFDYEDLAKQREAIAALISQKQ